MSNECDNKETKIIQAPEKRKKRERGGEGNTSKDANVFFFVHIYQRSKEILID